MLRMSMRLSGISRWQMMSGRRSLSVTIAARVRRLLPLPVAIAPRLADEQGTTTMPSWMKLPEAIVAPTSLLGWMKSRREMASESGWLPRVGTSSASVRFLILDSSKSSRRP